MIAYVSDDNSNCNMADYKYITIDFKRTPLES